MLMENVAGKCHCRSCPDQGSLPSGQSSFALGHGLYDKVCKVEIKLS